MISRRTLLAGIVAAPAAAPAIVKAAIAPGASYGTLADWSMGDALALAGDLQVSDFIPLTHPLDGEIEKAWRDWAQFELSALSPSDIRAECARAYIECERLGLLVSPPSEPHDAALDSMYERD